MKTRILTALALVVALPAVAQANSFATEQALQSQHEALNVQTTSDYQALSTRYAVDTVQGGHSAAADQALTQVAEQTQRGTHLQPGSRDLIGQGQSVAAAQALQNTNAAAGGQGNVEVSFASLD
ncbi:hypothetical protein [Salinicola rhizosphaerae]|uniref:DUF4148 domain-containing protein n=1 Tax=Salinicola rhizosphaerae TaxID=1443141 RepID=A0ABQ3DXZ2_9GAMM|nr:hypothetical protein [Salinicola rhizosphaerae]GHB19266.1 hypothetical protein GCM10009038_17400 [Salinicola rhizosphaerae]